MKTAARGALPRPDRPARWLAVVGIPAAAVLVSAAYLTHEGDAPPTPPTTTALSRTAQPGDIAAARLRSEVVELRAAVAALDGRTASEASPSQSIRNDEDLSKEARQARYEGLVERQAEAIERAIAVDPPDPAWSAKTELHLRDGFGKAGLAGAHLDETYCGSTMCRIRVHFDSMAVLNDGVDGVVDLVGWNSDLIARADPADQLRFVVYATRAPGLFPKIE